jgi:hypothetical protein
MSRYEYLPKGWPPHLALAVGWDPALRTFFAHVLNYRISRDDDCVVLWLGALAPKFLDVDQLLAELNRRIRGKLPAVTLTKTLRDKLQSNKRRYIRGGRPKAAQ